MSSMPSIFDPLRALQQALHAFPSLKEGRIVLRFEGRVAEHQRAEARASSRSTRTFDAAVGERRRQRAEAPGSWEDQDRKRMVRDREMKRPSGEGLFVTEAWLFE